MPASFHHVDFSPVNCYGPGTLFLRDPQPLVLQMDLMAKLGVHGQLLETIFQRE